jgi:hypothetical protein
MRLLARELVEHKKSGEMQAQGRQEKAFKGLER